MNQLKFTSSIWLYLLFLDSSLSGSIGGGSAGKESSYSSEAADY